MVISRDRFVETIFLLSLTELIAEDEEPAIFEFPPWHYDESETQAHKDSRDRSEDESGNVKNGGLHDQSNTEQKTEGGTIAQEHTPIQAEGFMAFGAIGSGETEKCVLDAEPEPDESD
ncbi:unnamed protein product [Cuscuta campestris]|uniref:Uncharacterized protein n=1 Tax=Cuscuta campestris TaxID=132261 RepID=A0A484NL70_9ASTE|nr:unnamed protein product [Cuscuta campestris]